jgi:hypothetical protein
VDIGGRTAVVLVTGGRWHDFDFARLRLLTELDRHDVTRTRVRDDFGDLAALSEADVLVTYTCDLRPSVAQTAALAQWLRRGGRWLALHGTNSAIDAPPDRRTANFTTPRVIDGFVELLGGQFLAHPPIDRYLVEVSDPTHPLLAGLTAFETTDELYVCQMRPPVTVIMHATFDGECRGFDEGRPAGTQQPVLWQKRTGDGLVTYLTLGHCRVRWDVADVGVADNGRSDRVAWEAPGFRSLLARTLAWAVHGDDWPSCNPDRRAR